MNTCKKGFYIASERPAALLLDLPLRSIPPTALRLWVPPIHVAMGGHRSRSRQPDASAERNGRRLPGSKGRADRGTEAGADIRGLRQQGVTEAGSKEVGDFAIWQNLRLF